MKKAGFFLFVVMVLNSCELFTTRDPEDPDTGRSGFIPPISPEIVIENLSSAIIENNPENYTSCLAIKESGFPADYQFIPSAEGLALFPEIFTDWDFNSERQYFNYLVSSLNLEDIISFTLTQRETELVMPDSVVYTSPYILQVPHGQDGLTEEFRGSIRLTIAKSTSGKWAIIRWRDFETESDENIRTWSYLKAFYYN